MRDWECGRSENDRRLEHDFEYLILLVIHTMNILIMHAHIWDKKLIKWFICDTKRNFLPFQHKFFFKVRWDECDVARKWQRTFSLISFQHHINFCVLNLHILKYKWTNENADIFSACIPSY